MELGDSVSDQAQQSSSILGDDFQHGAALRGRIIELHCCLNHDLRGGGGNSLGQKPLSNNRFLQGFRKVVPESLNLTWISLESAGRISEMEGIEYYARRIRESLGFNDVHFPARLYSDTLDGGPPWFVRH